MSLTHDEQHRFNEIELHLRSSDPTLARRLDPSSGAVHESRLLIRSVLLLLLGTAVMVAGAAGVTGVISYGTVFVVLGVALMVRAIQRLRDLNPPPAASAQ